MKADFDFDSIGKREPYEVPGNFFQSLEDNIMKQSAAARRHRPSWRFVLAGADSVAAVMAILLSTGITASLQQHGFAMEDVEQVFDRLSEADQNFLLETYYDDIFINPQ